MRPSESDAALLWDMRRAALEVEGFVAGVTLETYLGDLMRQRAVERSVEIIGEAARKVSRPLREAHPEIDWRPIAAQRHILAHDYATVLPSRLWRVATVHVPELMARLDAILPEDPDP